MDQRSIPHDPLVDFMLILAIPVAIPAPEPWHGRLGRIPIEISAGRSHATNIFSARCLVADRMGN